MTRKTIMGLAAAAVVAAVLVLLFKDRIFRAGHGQERLNVLLITLDTTRADCLECYGHEEVKTPFINALAEEGTLFEQCTTSAPITLPAHASLLTATHPFVHGVRNNGQIVVDSRNTSLAEILESRGYATCARTAAFVLHSCFGLNQGFQDYQDVDQEEKPGGSKQTQGGLGDPLPPGTTGKGGAFAAALAEPSWDIEKPANVLADSAIDWLRSHAENDDSQPFFLWVHFYDPHSPFEPPRRFREAYPEEPYLGEIAFTDEQLGRILDVLDELDLSGRTLVVLVGDHGEGLGQHEEPTHTCFLYDTTLSVPLIFRAPDVVPENSRISSQVRIIDVAPTILEILGIDPMKDVQGGSLLPLIREERSSGFAAYSETFVPSFEYQLSHLRSIRIDGWKYIHAPLPELYRVKDDPGETRNVATENPKLVSKMRGLLKEMLAAAPPPAEDEPSSALSPEDRERLMALGYMGGLAQGKPSGRELDLFEPSAGDPKNYARELRLVTQGLGSMRHSRFNKAIELLSEAARLQPSWRVPRELIAISLTELGRKQEAVALFEEILEEDPENAGTNTRLAILHAEMGNRSKARHHHREALRANPELPDARKWLTQDALRRGRHDEALAELRAAIKHAPENVSVLSLLSWNLATCPDDSLRSGEEALVLAELACKLSEGKNALALQSLAAALAETGRMDEAVEKATEAASLASARGKQRLARSIEKIRDSYYSRGKPYHQEK